MLSNVCMFILKCQLLCVVFYSVIVVLLPSFHCDTDSISVLKSAYEEDEQKAVEKQQKKVKNAFHIFAILAPASGSHVLNVAK